MSSYNQPQWQSWLYGEAHDPYNTYSHFPSYSSYLADSMEAYQTNHHHLVHHHQMSRTTESKPRLSKEEVEVLEAEFQKNHKPNSSTKKALAESMRVDNARINNWFQNRRAREKKERNIREYEAKQQFEKDHSGSEPGDSVVPECKRDLVASSAPFPSIQGPARSLTETPDSSRALGRSHGNSESFDSVLPSTETADGILIKAEPHSDSLTASHVNRAGKMSGPGRVSHYISPGLRAAPEDAEGDFSPSADDEDAEFFDPVNGAARGTHFHGQGNFEYIPNPMSQSAKSPPATDIASRRNRRPPMLSINPSRSYSAGLLKTGVDMGKRMDCGSSMRRVASATGPSRVCKPMGVPRTPFLGRGAGDMSQMKQSPATSGPKGGNAPPTPDTPIVANQPGLVDQSIQAESDSESSGRLSAAELAVHDPTLRTPPTTPGVVDNFFSINAVYNMSVQEGSVAGSSYSSNFEMPMSMSMSVPSYIANADGCSSQPQTPSFHPQVAGGYFGMPVSNAEYQWPDDSASRSHSPGGNMGQTHFMNMTSSNFAPMGR